MGREPAVTKLIADRYPSMSKGHKKVAEYVLDHRYEAAFLTLQQLAENANVSRGTAERFSRELGFDGYPDFRQSIAELIQENLHPLEKVRLGSSRQISPSMAFRSVLSEDIHNLERTLESISDDQFARIVDIIVSARRVAVVGVGVSAYLGGIMSYRLSSIRPDVVSISGGEEEAYRQMFWMDEGDCLIAIALPRYARLTVELSRYAHGKGVKTIGITDRLGSPLYHVCDDVLVGASERELLINSPTVVIALIDAIVTAIAVSDQQQTFQSMKEVTHELIDARAYIDTRDAAPDSRKTRRKQTSNDPIEPGVDVS